MIPCREDANQDWILGCFVFVLRWCRLVFVNLVDLSARWDSISEIQAIPQTHHSCTSHWSSKGPAEAACPEHPFSLFFMMMIFLQKIYM